MGRTSEMAFLEGQIHARKDNEGENQMEKRKKSLRFIDEALKKHIQFTKTLPPGFNFYINLNPDFLIEISKEYFQFSSIDIDDNKSSKISS